MSDSNRRNFQFNISIPSEYTQDLKGKQSVRATFKLTEGCINAISIVATQLGIKQKSLFDHLIEDMQSLQTIAENIADTRIRRQNRVQKTYVISRRSLYSLDQVAKSYNAPRDALIEFLVQRLLPVIVDEQDKHEKRKAAFAKITRHFNQGVRMLEEMEQALGEGDPVHARFESAMAYYQNAYDTIASYMEKGKIIEDFSPDMMRRILLK